MHGRRLLYTRSDLEAFDDYDRMLILHNRALDGTLAAVSMAEPVFERGLFMVIHARGLLMNSEWSDADGGPLGYLRFGEIFDVVELSPRYDGHYVVPHYEAGRVRARVERWDGVSGYISVYNTRRMQHFAVPVDGEAPWFRPGHLLRQLMVGLQQPRLPLAAPPMAFENHEEEWVEPDVWKYLEDPKVVTPEDEVVTPIDSDDDWDAHNKARCVKRAREQAWLLSEDGLKAIAKKKAKAKAGPITEVQYLGDSGS